jgi:HD superfamily phosphohydrolase
MTNLITRTDYVWGSIVFDSRFDEMVKCLSCLKEKRQLGLTYRNPYIVGGNHSRYEHSIGTYHVATLFIKACEKFKEYFEISDTDANAFCLSALFHDLGHGAYSHAFERFSNTFHEDETISKVLLLEDKFDNLFGTGMCNKVVSILRNSYSIKKDGNYDISKKPDLAFVLSALMSGAIDVDRIDYLSRDSLNVYGKAKDFSDIFSYMEIDLVNDAPKIVFDQRCIPILEDYFLTRFRNYSDIYFQEFTNVLDQYFEYFVTDNYTPAEITPDLEESRVDMEIKNGPYKTYRAKRSAEVISGEGHDSILIRSFENQTDLNVFVSKLSSIIDLDEYYYTKIIRKVVIYDSKKNNVLIKIGDKVVDFSEVSQIIKDKISKEIISIFVDLNLLEHKLEELEITKDDVSSIIKKIKNLFNSSIYEVEKKFLIASSDMDEIASLINSMSPLDETTNIDRYFSYSNMPSGISIRLREGKEYTIKLPATDSTSLTKRQEHVFDKDLTQEVFLEKARYILTENGYQISGEILESLNIVTKRLKCELKIKYSTLEVAIDSSEYIAPIKSDSDQMIEIELKAGNAIDLWYFVESIQEKFKLTDCHDSKYSRAIQKTSI